MTERLNPTELQPLPLGQIKPAGWLRDQLQIQANGLSGHLDEFWPSVAQSKWIGGEAEGWERGPYWLDGVIPLAFLLDDEKLQAKVRRWVDYILDHAQADGWLGPLVDKNHGYEFDPWPRFVLLKAFTQYHEATGDERIIPAMQRLLKKLDAVLTEQPLKSWGHYRWADLVVSIFWLYDRTGEAWLLDLSQKVKAQGFDWGDYFKNFPDLDKVAPEKCTLINHGVNNAMALKGPAIWSRQSGSKGDLQEAYNIIETLDRYHGQANGVFTCDEHLAGLNPSQGSELCTVVEYQYSLEEILAVSPDPKLADLLELITYNALPATFTPDMWGHQYDQQVNQAVCKYAEDRVYTNNGPDSNLYGLEPHFGCCTANMHQGWPKFVSHLWMKSADGGLAAIAYGPCMVDTEIGGAKVRLVVETNYPFEGDLKIKVTTDQPASFPLKLRIPAWAAGAEVQLAGEKNSPEAGTFYTIEREWSGETEILLQLPLATRLARRYHGSVSIYRGPLLFGLKIEEDWRQFRGEQPHADWEVYPASAWNYALDLDPAQPETSITFTSGPVGHQPFAPSTAPVVGWVRGKVRPDWQIEHNAAGEIPISPVTADRPLEELVLLPYGSTNLRIAEFPVLAPGQAGAL